MGRQQEGSALDRQARAGDGDPEAQGRRARSRSHCSGGISVEADSLFHTRWRWRYQETRRLRRGCVRTADVDITLTFSGDLRVTRRRLTRAAAGPVRNLLDG